MKRFVAGLLLGLLLGFTGSAFAARMVGDNGYLIGWTVTVGGEEICADPYVWVSTREIECD
jgi:hypothetical protein